MVERKPPTVIETYMPRPDEWALVHKPSGTAYKIVERGGKLTWETDGEYLITPNRAPN